MGKGKVEQRFEWRQFENRTVILLYSGGVDSVLCLWKLVRQNIIPFIFHFYTWKLTKEAEKKIRKNAQVISPESPYYVFRPHTIDYLACKSEKYVYGIHMDEIAKKRFYPIQYGDVVVIGYLKKYGRGKRIHGDRGVPQREFIRKCERYGWPFLFPLSKLTAREIMNKFYSLPEDIQKNTVSTTRHYNFGGYHI